MLDFRLLGPVEVHDGARPIHLAGRRPRALLATLLLRRGEVVGTERLIDDLWGERPPLTARNSLHNHVSALRKALGSDAIVTTSDGYAVSVDADGVDVGRFERLLAHARAADSDDQRAAALREALALWRGPALADVAFDPFALLEAPRLEELRLVARQDLIDAELALQRHAEVLPDVEELVSAHPLDERLRAQLMLCLYRSGRQADALAAYRDARDVLVKELGIEPSPPLRDLEQAILRQDDALAPAPHIRPGILPTRRTVTVLIADVGESTSLPDHLDPEVLHGLVDRSFAAMRNAVERHGGAVQNLVGETLLAVFGVPARHEDDALRALRAAVELRDELAALGDQIELRIGIDTGEVFAADGAAAGARVTGAAMNVARRLEEAASPGEILLGAGTLRIVRAAVRTQPLEPLPLRGTDSVSAWRLLELVEGVPAIPRRLEAPLVGRRDELTKLRARFDEACAERRCRHVALVGDAGIGKTRVARELAANVRGEADVLVGRCVSYGQGATWLPLAEIVREAGGETPNRLSELVADEPDGELVARRVAGAIGAAGELTPVDETAWAVRRLFETLSGTRPLVVVFEDVHWAEPTLLDLIEYLGDHATGPILVLSLTRPELLETRVWAERAVTLRALPEADMTALVASLEDTIDAEGRRRVVEVAEGNPLFAEQLVARAVEEGPESLDSVPPSIEGLLASRLDLLVADERRVLQCAAIIGRQFAREAVVAVSTAERGSAVDEQLRSLAAKGLIRPESKNVLSFHHVLVRNAAYAGAPKADRAEVHERVGAWLEGRADSPDELVGHHFEQAYRYRAELGPPDSAVHALARRAAERLATAGRRAAGRDDWHAAANLLARAAALLPSGDADRPPLLARLGEALSAMGDFGEATRVLDEAIESARAIGDRGTEWRALIQQSLFQRTTDEDGWVEQARQDAERAITLFTELDDDRGLASAWRFGSWIEQWNGQYGAAVTSLERALEHARRAGAVSEAKRILTTIGPNLVFGPEPVEAAVGRLQQDLAAAEAEGQLALSANLSRDLGTLHAMAGRFDEARSALAHAKAILTELDLVSDYGLCAGFSAHVEGLAGSFEAAERDYRAAWSIFDETGESCRRLTAEVELAHVLVELGRDDEALRLAEVAARETPADEFYCHVLWRTARAKALARTGEVEEAEVLAREALGLVEPTDDLSTHAGVLVCLGEVLCAGGREGDAVPLIEKASKLYERKGNVVLAARTRALLDERRATAAAP